MNSERVPELIPDISLVVFDPVLPKETPKFILKAHSAMMLLLVLDIFVNTIEIRLTHRKCSITILPMKFPA